MEKNIIEGQGITGLNLILNVLDCHVLNETVTSKLNRRTRAIEIEDEFCKAKSASHNTEEYKALNDWSSRRSFDEKFETEWFSGKEFECENECSNAITTPLQPEDINKLAVFMNKLALTANVKSSVFDED